MKDFIKKKYKNVGEIELISLAQKDDYDALEELIRRMQKSVYASFYYLNADRENLSDLTQEVLLRMSKNIKNLKNPRLFHSWLGQIISNLFYDELRRKHKSLNQVSLENYWMNNPTSDDYAFDICDNKFQPDEKTCSKELNDLIKTKICDLPDHFRIVIILREIQGLSYEEIAKITKTNIGTVKSRIARARGKLQECLKPYLM